MSTRWLTALQIVELGLYTSKHAVLRAAKRGEIPPGTRFGKRFLWNEGRLGDHGARREGDTAFSKRRRTVKVVGS